MAATTARAADAAAAGRAFVMRGRRLLAGATALLLLAGGLGVWQGPGRPRAAEPPMMRGTTGGGAGTLAEIVARGEPSPGYWALPVPPQGPPPSGFSAREASLHPEACGACHAVQWAGWRSSLHARATSPGLRGQLVDLWQHDPASGLDCLACHAPLAEQRPVAPAGDGTFAGSREFDAALFAGGVTCAACHVRAHRRFAPPAIAGNPNTAYPAGTPGHGGVTRSAAFERAEFCAACHQFDRSAAVNGKPLQNTYAEWRGSEWGRRGVACQICHMPGRQHLWRGIHDPDMVRRALAARLELEPAAGRRGALRARLVVTNHGAGHHVPTYVTPTIVLRVAQADASGRAITGTARESRLRRDVAVEQGAWVERADTRLAAGATTVLRYDAPRHPRARALAASIEVRPDDFYVTRVYPGILADAATSEEGRRLVADALAAGQASPYLAWSATAPLPVAPRRP